MNINNLKVLVETWEKEKPNNLIYPTPYDYGRQRGMERCIKDLKEIIKNEEVSP